MIPPFAFGAVFLSLPRRKENSAERTNGAKAQLWVTRRRTKVRREATFVRSKRQPKKEKATKGGFSTEIKNTACLAFFAFYDNTAYNAFSV